MISRAAQTFYKAKQDAPTSSADRAAILDILRGFALLGIALANFGVLSYYEFLPPANRISLPTFHIDRWLSYFGTCFVLGKFYSLFSLLFGIGFSVIMAAQEAKGSNGFVFFYRRLAILLLLGLVHGLLIWDGDILFFYAVVGMLLPIFSRMSNKMLLVVAFVLLISPLFFFDLLKVVSDGRLNAAVPLREMAMETDKQYGITEENLSSWLIVNDSYSDLLHWNHSGVIWGWFLRMDGNRIPKVLAMFLIGMCVGREKLFLNLYVSRDLLKKIQLYGFVIGLPAGFALAFFGHDEFSLPHAGGLWDTLAYTLNVTPLCLAYAATLSLWYLTPGGKFFLDPLRAVGRMALTNYMMQSVVGILVFAGIGLGIGGAMGPAIYFPIVFSLFAIQIVYSNLWFKYFAFGPMEWVWRQLSYGKRFPLMRNAAMAKLKS